MSDSDYVCKCHERMGNDFWFLPSGSCLYDDPACKDKSHFLSAGAKAWEFDGMTPDAIEDEIDRRVADERERCMRLCIMRGDISRATAAKLRAAGTIKVVGWSWWPIKFRMTTQVHPKWERDAEMFDAVGRAFDHVAAFIQRGHDPRTLDVDPTAQVDLSKYRDMKFGSERDE